MATVEELQRAFRTAKAGRRPQPNRCPTKDPALLRGLEAVKQHLEERKLQALRYGLYVRTGGWFFMNWHLDPTAVWLCVRSGLVERREVDGVFEFRVTWQGAALLVE